MKRILCIILASVVLVLAVTLFLIPTHKTSQIRKPVNGEIPYTFPTQTMGKITGTMIFHDTWFNASSFEYNHALATASLQASVSGTSSGSDGTALIRPFLTNIGCPEDTFFLKDFDVTDHFDDVCSFAFGLKSLVGTDTYLLPVIIRGGGYDAEWASNMRVYAEGYEKYASGFRKSAEYAVGYLNEYIDALEASGISRSSLKLWITGYSRGAAIANNVAQIMTEDGRIPAESIFGYSFATPETVLENEKGDYKNIFSICSELDLVPRLPLLEWGYTHFGTSLYLPCESKNGEAYADLLAGMQEEFDKYMTEIGSPWLHYNPIRHQEKAFDLLAFFLTSAISTPEEYATEGLQDFFADLMGQMKGTDNIDAAFISSLIPDVRITYALIGLLQNATMRSNEENAKELDSLLAQIKLRTPLAASKRDRELLSMLYNILSDYSILMKAEPITDEQNDSAEYYYALIDTIFSVVKGRNSSPLMMQHWPEVYLAWMKSSEDGSDIFTDGHHQLVSIKRPSLYGDVNDDGEGNAADISLIDCNPASDKSRD